MQDRYTFEYAIIRIVPKVEREEFFNVGVVLFSKQKKFLGIKYYINPDKLKSFSAEIELDIFNDLFKRLEINLRWKTLRRENRGNGIIR